MDLIAELRAALGDAEAELALERARAVLALAAAVSRPPDGEALVARSEAAADRADIPAALEAAMAAARAHRAAGCHVAAIDALLRAQPLAPDDRELHLLLAELQADQGWTAVAAEKLRHLARLAELEGEPEAAARILGTGWSGGPAAALAEPGPG
ncbi:MAG: hypothetical protein MUC54_07490 [Chloroflexi bacterium]|nr:hypothetical protein [Chloroflexota bacterium]